MAPSALPTDPEPTHHVTLVDRDGLAAGLVLTDSRGQNNHRAITRNPLRRTGIKISQGQSQHGDLLPPFSEVDQDDWSGGIGQLDLHDRSRYYHGEMIDTSFKNKLMLGPLPSYSAVGSSTPYRKCDGQFFGSQQFVSVFGAQRHIAISFVASASYSARRILLLVRRVGLPNDNLSVTLHSDSAGVPGSTLASSIVPRLTPYTLFSRMVVADFGGTVALTVGTTYWVRVKAVSASDNSLNCHQVACAGFSTYDTFDGLTGTLIANHRPSVRQTNAILLGVAPPAWLDLYPDVSFTLISGKLQGWTVAIAEAYAIITSGIKQVIVQADITRNNNSAGLVTRYAGPDYIYAYTDGTNIKLFKKIGGTPTELGTASFSWPIGATHRLAVRCQLTNFKVSVDGVDVITASVSDLPNAVIQGIWTDGTSSSAQNVWDNFSVVSIGTTLRSSDGSAWTMAEFNMRARVTDTPANFRARFYEYKGGTYFVTEPDAVAAARIFIAGDRGVATGAQTSTTLKDTTKAWTTDEFKGGYVKIVEGPGKGQYAEVLSNTADTLTIVGTWRVTPVAGTSAYTFAGVDFFREISGHGLTGPVTDVQVSSKDVIYFAQGDSINVRRMREYITGAAWTREYADDSTNKATLLEEYRDPGLGPQVVGSMNVDANGDVSVAQSNTPVWATNLTWTTRIVCGKRDAVITGLDHYGAPERPWILKEDSLGEIVGGIFTQVPLREIAAVRSQLNGVVPLVHDLFLYFSFGRGGLERYYQDKLHDVGPNRDDGLPLAFQGPFSDAVGYPGKPFLSQGSLDWPVDRYASVFKYNGGWHPWYRHPEIGVPIRDVHIQVNPGPVPDWMWLSVGSDVMYVKLPSEVFDPSQDETMEYYHEGLVQLSSNFFDFYDTQKFFDKLKIRSERLLFGCRFITGRYDVDDGTGFHDFSIAIDQSPVQNMVFASSDGHQGGELQGKRVTVHLIINTLDKNNTPIMKAIVQSGVEFLDTKFRVDLTFRLADEDVDLNGDEDDLVTAEAKSSRLENWAATGALLRMRCVYSPYDNKLVSIDPEALNPYAFIPDEQVEGHVGQLGLVELR